MQPQGRSPLCTTSGPPEQGQQHKHKAGEFGEAIAEARDRHTVNNPLHHGHMPKSRCRPACCGCFPTQGSCFSLLKTMPLITMHFQTHNIWRFPRRGLHHAPWQFGPRTIQFCTFVVPWLLRELAPASLMLLTSSSSLHLILECRRKTLLPLTCDPAEK